MITLRTLFLPVAIGTAVLAAAPAASAVSDPPPSHAVSGPGIARAAQIPAGYVSVDSASQVILGKTQTLGAVQCPAGTVPFSGGALINSLSTTISTSSSFPTAQGWTAVVSNGSTGTASFRVRVVCGNRPANYRVVRSAHVEQKAGSRIRLAATCPIGSKPLGGGARSTSQALFVNISSLFPAKRTWFVDENNASPFASTLQGFAVCGSFKTYSVVTGGVVANPANTQTTSFAFCPSLTAPVGGGGKSGSSSVGVTLSTSVFAGTTAWAAIMNNATALDTTLGAVAVCAGS